MFRSVNDFLLHTGPTSSLRHILYNGWGLEKDEVLVGFTTLAKFMGVFLIFPVACSIYVLWGHYYFGVILKVIARVLKERVQSERPPSTTETEACNPTSNNFPPVASEI